MRRLSCILFFVTSLFFSSGLLSAQEGFTSIPTNELNWVKARLLSLNSLTLSLRADLQISGTIITNLEKLTDDLQKSLKRSESLLLNSEQKLLDSENTIIEQQEQLTKYSMELESLQISLIASQRMNDVLKYVCIVGIPITAILSSVLAGYITYEVVTFYFITKRP